MKLLKGFLKYIFFFILGVMVCATVGFTALSYWTVDQLTKALEPVSDKNPSLNVNLREIILIGAQYMEELDLFDRLTAEVGPQPAPEMCSILCNPSNLNREKLAEERSRYLMEYYKNTGTSALKDPLFRLRLEDIGFLSRLFPESLRSVLREVVQTKKVIHEEPTKFILALKLQWGLFKEMTNLFLRWERLKQETSRLDQYRELIQLCEKGQSPKKVISECNSASH